MTQEEFDAMVGAMVKDMIEDELMTNKSGWFPMVYGETFGSGPETTTNVNKEKDDGK